MRMWFFATCSIEKSGNRFLTSYQIFAAIYMSDSQFQFFAVDIFNEKMPLGYSLLDVYKRQDCGPPCTSFTRTLWEMPPSF